MKCEDFWNRILAFENMEKALAQDEELKSHVEHCEGCRGEMSEANALFRTAIDPNMTHLIVLTEHICAAERDKKQKTTLNSIWKRPFVFVPAAAVAAIFIFALTLPKFNSIHHTVGSIEEKILAIAPQTDSKAQTFSINEEHPQCNVQNRAEAPLTTGTYVENVTHSHPSAQDFARLLDATLASNGPDTLPHAAYEFFQVDAMAWSTEGTDDVNAQNLSDDSLTAMVTMYAEFYDLGGG